MGEYDHHRGIIIRENKAGTYNTKAKNGTHKQKIKSAPITHIRDTLFPNTVYGKIETMCNSKNVEMSYIL